MLSLPLKATSHLACWFLWHSMGVSLLDDLEAPQPPGAQAAGYQAA